MPSNRAAWLSAEKTYPFEIKEAPYPEPGVSEIVVKVSAVAINPVDGFIQATGYFVHTYPMVIGCDAAGTIVQIGSKVQSLKEGDKVFVNCSAVTNQNPRNGGFQEYLVVGVDRACKFPDKMSFEEASVFPTAMHTSSLALFHKDYLGLPPPKLDTKPGSAGAAVLIWGGSSSIGTIGIQLAVAAGFDVVTTSSERNREFCKALGASHVFDYNSHTVIDDIVKVLQATILAGVYNAVSNAENIETAATILQRLGKPLRVITSLPGLPSPPGVENIDIESFPSVHMPEIWVDFLPQALEVGKILPTPKPEVHGKGLESIQGAVDTKGVSAVKIVVSL